MFTSIVFTASLLSHPIRLEHLSPAAARGLAGQRVTVVLDSSRPSQVWEGTTIIGCDEQPDEVERSVILRGERADVDWRRVWVRGVVRVIEHPGAMVNGEVVPPWVEIRVEE